MYLDKITDEMVENRCNIVVMIKIGYNQIKLHVTDYNQIKFYDIRGNWIK